MTQTDSLAAICLKWLGIDHLLRRPASGLPRVQKYPSRCCISQGRLNRRAKSRLSRLFCRNPHAVVAPRAGKARLCCIRHADLPAQCGFAPPQTNAGRFCSGYPVPASQGCLLVALIFVSSSILSVYDEPKILLISTNQICPAGSETEQACRLGYLSGIKRPTTRARHAEGPIPVQAVYV
jgi:hypothetical protein